MSNDELLTEMRETLDYLREEECSLQAQLAQCKGPESEDFRLIYMTDESHYRKHFITELSGRAYYAHLKPNLHPLVMAPDREGLSEMKAPLFPPEIVERRKRELQRRMKHPIGDQSLREFLREQLENCREQAKSFEQICQTLQQKQTLESSASNLQP